MEPLIPYESVLLRFKDVTAELKNHYVYPCQMYAQVFHHILCISSVQSLSHVRLFANPRTAAHKATLSITNSQSLLKLMSFESMLLSNHLILCCPLLLPPSIFPSSRVF